MEEYIEKLQNLNHDAKKKIMWIGVPAVMVVIIFVWFSYTDFGFKEEVSVDTKENISKLEILKNGFIATLKDAGNLLKDFKEKINQTNTFEIKVPASSTQADLVSATTTQKINE